VAARRSTFRCDNGPELTANAIKDWCRFSGAGSAYIEPGSPWQNPYVESFGSRVRDELFGIELFSSLAEAKVMVADWREDYNERRPHSALQMMAPAKFAKAWREAVAEGKVIPFTDPAKALRSPENSSSSVPTGENVPDSAPAAVGGAPAALLRSPSGLAPQGGGTPTLHINNSHRLSQQVDR
jgi:hypothetical protein